MSMAPLGTMRMSTRISLDAASILLDVPSADLSNVTYHCLNWNFLLLRHGFFFPHCFVIVQWLRACPNCGRLFVWAPFSRAATHVWQTFTFLFCPELLPDATCAKFWPRAGPY